jgi:uroporphyrin-III C-methyltransferase / precorrin-2 dehydrogenase / sirohydrochlorin ferrochelatase
MGGRVPPATLRPARMASLDVLPVFFTLSGRRAVVAGNGDAAAWKAELLAAAGAEVHVLAPRPNEALVALSLQERRVVLTRRAWQAEDFAGTALAVAEADDTDTGAAFHTAAKAAGVPCNVIDRPAFCDFQFGTVVNRSPVVIGISTAGAAPVLGQAIRRRIEAILPADIGRWAAAAKAFRVRLAHAVAEPLRRRMIWSRFADRVFASRPICGGEPCLDDLLLSDGGVAGVTLVGAGPGSTEFLTFGAVRALQLADVILYDALVSPEILELARREADRIDVGKRAGRHSCRQDEITARMIDLARAGKRVVRLKSGDPMIFGRAAEEIDALREAGIPVEVVPGITAGLALAARLGVSLTDRRTSHSVRLVTGHGKGGDVPADLDWRGLADPATTLVFYMAGRIAGKLARKLMAEGLPADTPIVAAAAIGRANEQIVRGSLDETERLVAELNPDDPAIIGVGAVFACPSNASSPVSGSTIARSTH